jgi:hypothetical protein
MRGFSHIVTALWERSAAPRERLWQLLLPSLQRVFGPVLESSFVRRQLALTEQRLMQLPPWQRQAGSALILIALTLAAWRLTVAPELDRYRSTRMLHAARERLLEIGVVQARRGAAFEVEGTQLPERLAQIRRRFYRVDETAALIESLAERARARGLSWVEVQVGPLEPLTQLAGFAKELTFEAIADLLARASDEEYGMSVQQISFEVVGSAIETLGLLGELESNPRLVLVEIVDVRQEPRNRVSATMVFNAVLLDGGGEDHEGTSGSQPGLHVDDHHVGGAVSPSD